jgi:hypothetical protein
MTSQGPNNADEYLDVLPHIVNEREQNSSTVEDSDAKFRTENEEPD